MLKSTASIAIGMTLGAALLSGDAWAAPTGTATFTGLVLDSCTVTTGSPGLLAASSDGRMLASTQAGGVPSLASVLTTSASYQFEVDAPSALAASPSGGQADRIDTSFDATGVTSVVARVAGTPLALNLGLTEVRVNSVATKSAGTFPAGAYRLDVVLRCIAR